MPVSKWSAAGTASSARNAERQPLLEHRERGEARHQPVLGVELGGAGQEAVENEDVRVRHRGADRQRLVERRGEEELGTGRARGPGDLPGCRSRRHPP